MRTPNHQSPSNWANDVVETLAQAVAAIVMFSFLTDVEENTEPSEILREILDRVAEENQRDDLRHVIDWDAFEVRAPRSVGEATIGDIVGASVFYSRLMSRALVRGDDGTSPFDDDTNLLAMLKVLTTSLSLMSMLGGMPSLMAFTSDFTDYGVTQAIANGLLVQDPKGEEGDYVFNEQVQAAPGNGDEIRGPWGLSRDAFTNGDFPHDEEIYDTLMAQVAAADAVVTV